MKRVCYQINLQCWFGGGEVYTGFVTKALHSLGWENVIFVHEEATFWEKMSLPGTTFIRVSRFDQIAEYLPQSRCLLIFHTLPRPEQINNLNQHLLTCFAHMPLFGRDPSVYKPFQVIFAVSQYVMNSLAGAEITQYYPEPLYGVADLDRTVVDNSSEIRSGMLYSWDKHKFRDVLLSYIYPLYYGLKPATVFSKRPGLTLGIVSVIGPIKQFSALFKIISPIIRQFPMVNVEIFGYGGYASVRDLKRALAPIRSQVRLWGKQENVKKIYPHLDFLLAGLPEKEALGLNIIEAQSCGVPVIAVKSPPFTETIIDGKTGLFYNDPRKDSGRDFARLLTEIHASGARPNPFSASEHLKKFSFEVFATRLKEAMDYALTHFSQNTQVPNAIEN